MNADAIATRLLRTLPDLVTVTLKDASAATVATWQGRQKPVDAEYAEAVGVTVTSNHAGFELIKNGQAQPPLEGYKLTHGSTTYEILKIRIKLMGRVYDCIALKDLA